jgi:hypothetical protein
VKICDNYKVIVVVRDTVLPRKKYVVISVAKVWNTKIRVPVLALYSFKHFQILIDKLWIKTFLLSYSVSLILLN